MSTKIYQLPVEKTGWQTGDKTGTAKFTWDYDDGRDKLINLYDKGKRKQWDAKERIDWSHNPNPENPLEMPDESSTHLRFVHVGQAHRRGAGNRASQYGRLAVQPVPPW